MLYRIAMTQQPFEFAADPDLSRGRHNDESAAAHEKIKPSKKVDRTKVWMLIHESGGVGMTLEQLAWRMAKVPSAISGRLTELMAQGMIWKKAEKGTTTSGNSCSIYVCK